MLPRTTQTLSDAPASPPEAAHDDAARRHAAHARGVGQMLDLTVDLFVARCLPVVGIAFLMWLPVRLFTTLSDGFEGDLALGSAAFGLLAALAVQILSVAFTIQIVYAEIQGRPVGWRAVFAHSLRRGPALLVSTAMITVALWVGYACLIVPGVALTFLWSAAPAALVLEDRGPLACLVRSQRLVGSRFLPWAGMMASMFVLRLAYDSLTGALDTPQFHDWVVETAGLSTGLLATLRVVLGSLLAAVSSAAWSIAVTVFYIDCRTRLEGFDLAMRIERLEDDARAAAGANAIGRPSAAAAS